jgi:hypothetical protein
MLVQAFVSEFAVEALDIRVLRGFTGLDQSQFDLSCPFSLRKTDFTNLPVALKMGSSSGGNVTVAPSPFPIQHRWDRTFFLTCAVMAWIAILRGFGPELYGHFIGASPFPPLIVHFHAAAFFGWLILFTTQIWLIRSKRLALHRRLGLMAAALVPIMVVLGLITNTVMQRRHFEAGRPELDFMIVPISDMVLFGSLAVAGLLLRRNPATHKRLMLLATVCVLDAGFGRWFAPWISSHFGDGYFGFLAQLYLGGDAIVLAAVLYDVVTRRRVHPVYLAAVPWILSVQAATSAIYHAPGWLPIARSLIGH